MGSFGPNNGNTFSSDATLGVVPIVNPVNAALADGIYATAVLLTGQTSQYLKVTGFNFDVPLDATITGVTAEVRRSATIASDVTDNSVKLVVSGVIQGVDHAGATLWPLTDAIASYGGPNDSWGLILTPTLVNRADFGVVISAKTAVAATALIDYINLTVDYTGSGRVSANSYVTVGDGMSRNEAN